MVFSECRWRGKENTGQRVCLQRHLKGLPQWNSHPPLCLGAWASPEESMRQLEGEIYILNTFAADFSLHVAFWHPFHLLYIVYGFCILVSDDQGCH